MHLNSLLPYVILAIYKKNRFLSEHRGRDLAGFSAPCREKTQDLALALMNRPTELACNQECFAFQKEKQRAVRTLILLADISLFSDGSFAECRSEQTAILAARIIISLYLALVYLKPLPELGQLFHCREKSCPTWWRPIIDSLLYSV